MQSLIKLASSSDDKTAVAALRAMSRERFSGCEKAFKKAAESSKRSDLVRLTALGAWLNHCKHDKRGWSDVKGYVKKRTKDDDKATKFAGAWSKRLWGSEVSDE